MGTTETGGIASEPEDGDAVSAFYDSIAEDYDLAVNLGDWRESVEAEGRSLEAIVATRLGAPAPWRVLDCSCGIGTQAIGLALRGHHVVGTDLSERAVERARREAASAGVTASFAVADMRRLQMEVEGEFDVVLSCDNSFAHLGGADLTAAVVAMRSKLAPGGLAVVSIRDYDVLGEQRPRVPDLPRVHDTLSGRRVMFQLWDWEPDASGYVMTWLFLSEAPGGFETSQVSTRLHAHRRSQLAGEFADAGYLGPTWYLPDGEPAFHQPVLTARRP